MIYDNKKNFSNKFILQRKTRSTINVSSINGKHKKVYIEIRKKCTYTRFIQKDIDVHSKESDVIHDCRKSTSITSEEIMESNKMNDDVRISQSILEQKKLMNDVCFNENCQFELDSKKENKLCINDRKFPLVLNVKQFVVENNFDDVNYQLTEGLSITDAKNVSKKSDYKLASVNFHNNENSKKLHHERRYRARSKPRNRLNNSKFVKQKRSNNYRVYDDFEINELGKDEELCISTYNNKVNKKKCKPSVLVQGFNKPVQKMVRNVVIGKTISVSELANKMSVKSIYVIKVMMRLGLIATINQIIDQDTAQLIVEEMGHKVILRHENELEEFIMRDRGNNNNKIYPDLLERRAPIVTIMGHVDHGKTSLLDCIRSTKIASSEIGGITQKIGAYHVHTDNGMITFLDTPGHAAFSTMRARGIGLTDLAVLVVAADDGVMPQTVEAIQHIKTAKVPVVIAINKIDKIQSNNVERIKHDLSHYGLIPEEWGGNTQYVNVSAMLGDGIDDLLDAILLQAEILELNVLRNGMGMAVVIESYLDKGRGPVVTVLVREGVLKCGDMILCGTEYGRIRAMRDEFGHGVLSAGPSIPVELLGLSGIPMSGEIAVSVRDEKKAREVALCRQEKFRELKLTRKQESNIDNIFNDMKNNNVASDLNLIIKSDTQGSLEAVCESLLNLSTDKVIVKILSSSIGDITETDAVLASASHAILLGFNVRADIVARRIIETNKLNVHFYSVIYDVLHAVEKIINGVVPVIKNKNKPIGLARVCNIFQTPKRGNIAGCIVVSGLIKRHKKLRVVRDNMVIYEGLLESLRHFKCDINEVQSGMECGISIKNYNDIRSGDMIEVFD